ncbi:MAG TPA: alkaline phosphatase family protein [Acidobacteriaceae bacterium]|nr:alkaline phosphatase family protein [Acidobacteriaceae bacterium]
MKHLALLLAGTAALAFTGIPGHAEDNDFGRDNHIKHVLLISIDGMHAVDFQNCAHGVSGVNGGAPYCPSMAALGSTGVNYVAASTSRPSDSFPGLMTIVSGATPRSMGVYYDVAYDRSLDAPAKTTGNGLAAGPCTAGAAPTGTRTEYEEGIDLDQSKLNGGAPGATLTDGGIASIDPQRLIRDPKSGCAPVFPWNFVRTNTIFGVIHRAGGYTAWSDKHPSYASVQGPGGNSLDDYFSPEINSLVVPVPGITTPAGVSCATVPDPSQLGSWTDSFANIQCYDTIKVDAILNEIRGKNHNGNARTQFPNLFGMNFQAVSVGQKLIEANTGSGGYLDASGTPSELLAQEIEFVDASIGKMVNELKDTGRFESTMIVITAKHGQGPIDPKQYRPIPGHSGDNGITPATLLANLIPISESPLNPTGIGATEDDVSLLWLSDSSQTAAAVATLEENSSKIGLGTIFYGSSLALNYDPPGLPPNGDPRSPDIIVTPNPGVVYTGSAAKQEEHGGFSHDDTNVMLLLSNPGFRPRTVFSDVATAQVAPTILAALGLNPNNLQGVQLEGTAVLPDLKLSEE